MALGTQPWHGHVGTWGTRSYRGHQGGQRLTRSMIADGFTEVLVKLMISLWVELEVETAMPRNYCGSYPKQHHFMGGSTCQQNQQIDTRGHPRPRHLPPDLSHWYDKSCKITWDASQRCTSQSHRLLQP